MSTPYTIAINAAAAVSMQSLGLAFTGLELANMNNDVAALRWTRRRASQACPIAHDDTVEIFRSGTRLFRGRAQLGTVTNEGLPIRLFGPWSHLEDQTYQMSIVPGSTGTPAGKVIGDTFSTSYSAGQSVWNGFTYQVLPAPITINWTVGVRASYTYPNTTGTVDVNMGWTARHWLFRPSGDASTVYTTVDEEWDRLMLFMTTTNSSPVFTEGTVALGGTLSPRVRTISDIRMSEAVRQVLALKPDAALWWTYSGDSVPVLNARVASLETSTELVIGTRQGMALPGYSLKVLSELIPAGVVIRWEREVSTSTGIGKPYVADIFPGMETATNCATTSGSNVVSCDSTANLYTGLMVNGNNVPSGTTVTAILSGTTFRISTNAIGTASGTRFVFRASTGVACYEPKALVHTVTDEIALAPGVAKEIYTALATPRAQGTLTVVDRDFSLGLRPGAVFTLAGDPQLEGVQLWVQGVSWSPDTGLAQLAIGYPAHLQLRDLVDLRGWLKAGFSTPNQSNSWVVPPP